MPDFYPDIHEFLQSSENAKSVKTQGIEDLAYYVRAVTGLEHSICLEIVRLYFQEIRNYMVNGDEVSLRNLGMFKIIRPNSKPTPYFKPRPTITNELNDRVK